MTPEEFRQALAERGVELNGRQMQQFADYYEYLIAVNEHVNLTAITEEGEVYLKHFYDSIIPALTVRDLQTAELTVCDVGVNAVILSKTMKGCHKLGIKQAETGPMLELNDKVQSQWKDFQTEQHKRRRCFIKEL